MDNITFYREIDLEPEATLQLSIAQDSSALSATPSEATADDKFSVKPNTPTTLYVKVNGSGFKSPEDRTATVSLKIGENTLVHAPVSLASIQSAGGSLLVPFTHTFSAEETGRINLQASVSSSEDANTGDNSAIQEMYVLCKVEDITGKAVPFHAQTETAWKEDPYGITANSSNPGTMQSYGCSVTAFEMLMESYGIHSTPLGSPVLPYLGVALPDGLNGETLNPGTLNKAFRNYTSNSILKGSTALDAHNNPFWPGMAEVARAGYQAQCSKTPLCNPADANKAISYKGITTSFDDTEGSTDRKFINREICSGNPVILKFDKTSGGQHFMLATGIAVDDGGKVTYQLNNPGTTNGRDQLQSTLENDFPSIVGYILYRPAADPSMMMITAPLNVHLVITDPLGHRSGFDPNTNTAYNEIPGASYGLQSINTPGDEAQPNKTLIAERYFALSQATDIPSGNYSVQVHALDSGSYYIDYRGYDSTGTTNNSSLKSGTLVAGQSAAVTINHSSEASLQLTADLALSEYSIKKEPRRTYSNTKVKFRGRIKTFKNANIDLNDQLILSIGGITGSKTILYASDFKVIRTKNETRYLYSKNHIEMILSGHGEFQIEMKNVDLSGLDKDQMSYVGLKVDNHFADKRLKLECRKNACKLPPLQGYCHFDKEDEE